MIIVRVVSRVLERADRFIGARWAGACGFEKRLSTRCDRANADPTRRGTKHCLIPWMGLLRLSFSSDKSWKARDVCTFVQSVKGDVRLHGSFSCGCCFCEWQPGQKV